MDLDIKNILTYQVQKFIPTADWFKFAEMKSKMPPPTGGGVTVPTPSKPFDPNAGDNLSFESFSLDRLFFIESDLLLDDNVEMSTLPENERIILIPYTNQLDAPQTITIKDTYKKITGWKAEFSESIQNSETISGSLNFKIKYKVIEFGGESKYEYKTVNTATYSKAINKTEEETLDISIPFNIPPKLKVDIKTGYRNSFATRKFSGFVKVEGDVIIRYGNQWVYAEKTKKLSSFLTEDLRAFNLNGYYSDIEYKVIPVELILIEKY
jgi:hypothetical protein